MKREKSPLGMLDELPALIAAGYEQVDEEDIVRLKWWGLYHDKPKIGTFMLRVKIPGGITSPAQLRAIGEISNVHGRGEGELSTRQNVQLHFIRLDALPDVFDRLHAAGLTSAGACGDTVRNITGCPLGGLAHDELFDPTPVLEEAAEFFYGNPDYSDLPRKLKIAITACPDACSAPEINCIALIGAIRDGEEGFGVLVGGGLSSVPRIARDLGIWVPKDEAVKLLAAILDEWREDLRYRVSRVKARLKFMIDDIGPEGMRERVEARLGRTFDDFDAAARCRRRATTSACTRSPTGAPTSACRCTSGCRAATRWSRLRTSPRASAAMCASRASRTSCSRTSPPTVSMRSTPQLAEIGLPLDAGTLRGDAVACTGEPHCNFSVTETKSRMDGLVQLLEEHFGKDADGLRMHLDGCPHACAHHWVGDLGFQGTTVRDEEGKRRQAYDIYLRGSLDRPAAIGARGLPPRADAKSSMTPSSGSSAAGSTAAAPARRSARSATAQPTSELGRLAGREPANTEEGGTA